MPEASASVGELPDLRLSVEFDKASYFADEVIVARVTVRNGGAGTATGVGVSSTGNIDSHYWDGFGWPAPTLEPGQTATGTASGLVTSAEDGVVRLVVTAESAEPDADLTDNVVTATVALSVVRGNYAGTVYGDRDGSATMDPGEELAGVQVRVNGGRPHAGHLTTTDAAGRFEFRGLPTGDYLTDVDAPQWAFAAPMVAVDEVDDPDVLIRGANWVTGVLNASAAFTRPTYAEGETAHLAVTLTNTGVVIPDVSARCSVDGGSLISAGELGQDGGAVMPARTSKTFDVTFRVDRIGALMGHVEGRCIIGAPPFVNGWISTVAVARVPGLRAPQAAGQLFRLLPASVLCPLDASTACAMPPPATVLPGVKVYLRSQVTGQVVTRAVTDYQGVFYFYDVPADRYDFGVVGPYTATTYIVYAYGDGGGPLLRPVYVQDGPEQPDPDSTPPPASPPAPAPPPQGANLPTELANTGTNLQWLALGALLSLALGSTLVIRTHRRPSRRM